MSLTVLPFTPIVHSRQIQREDASRHFSLLVVVAVQLPVSPGPGQHQNEAEEDDQHEDGRKEEFEVERHTVARRSVLDGHGQFQRPRHRHDIGEVAAVVAVVGCPHPHEDRFVLAQVPEGDNNAFPLARWLWVRQVPQ